MSEIKGPGWPDARGFVAAGYFGLAFYLLYMIGQNGKLLDNQAFMMIATLVIGTGGLGVVGSFFFGGTKSGSEVMTAQSAAQAAAVVAQATPPDPAPAAPPSPAKKP